MTDIILSDVVMKQKRGDVTNLPDIAPDGQLLVAKKDNKRLLYVGTGDDVAKISSSADAAGNPLVNNIISGNVDANGEPDFLTLYGIWQDWTQPTLSANGTLGNSSFAVGSTGENPSHPIYNMFDKQSTTFGQLLSTPDSLIIYNPNPLKISNINVQNVTGNDNFLNMKVYAGDTNPVTAITPIVGKDLKITFKNNDAADDYGVNTVNLIGSPTFTDQKFHSNGVTGLTMANVTNMGTGTWCIQAKFNFTNMTAVQSLFEKWTTASYGIVLRRTTTGTLILWLGSAATTWGIALEVVSTAVFANATDYYIRLRFTGTQYLVDYSTDGTSWTNAITVTSSTVVYNTTASLVVGYDTADSANPLVGTIDDIMVTVGSSTIIDKEAADLPTLLPSDYVLLSTLENTNHEASETWDIPLTLNRGYKYYVIQGLDYYDTYEPAAREIDITAQEYVKFGQILALKAGTHEVATYDSGTGKYTFDTITYPEFYGIDLDYNEILIEDAVTKDVSDYAQGVYQVFVNGGELDLRSNYFIQPEQPTVKQAMMGHFQNYGTPSFNDNGNYVGAADSYIASPFSTRYNQVSTWEIGFKYTHVANTVNNQVLVSHGILGASTTACSFAMYVENTTNLIKFNLSSIDNTTFDLGIALNSTVAMTPGTPYWLKFKFTGTAYILSVSTNGTSYTDYTILTTTTKLVNGNIRIGNNCTGISTLYNRGTIDMSTFYVLADGKKFIESMNYVWLDNSNKPYNQYSYNTTTKAIESYAGLHIGAIGLYYYTLNETMDNASTYILSNDFNKNYLDPVIDKLYEPGILANNATILTKGDRTMIAQSGSSFTLRRQYNVPIGPLVQFRMQIKPNSASPTVTYSLFDTISWVYNNIPDYASTSYVYDTFYESTDGFRNVAARLSRIGG